jgi:carbon-monoxide dehydrogenase medium subunit
VFQYARPASLTDVLGMLDTVPDARLLAGGTDLLVGVRKGKLRPPLVIDLKRVRDLAPGIELTGTTIRIGATTVLTDIIADARIRAGFPALVEAALVVGSIQIRNRATLAGNVCNASPAADTATPLLVHDAVVEIVGRGGTRRVPLNEFFLSPGKSALGSGELVIAIEIPLAATPTGSSFGRMTRRRGVDLATVNLCCSVSTAGETRFAFGAVGPRPFLAVDPSGALAGATGAEQDDILRALTARATPISNVRASREYRQEMLFVLARRALATARQRLREASDAGR